MSNVNGRMVNAPVYFALAQVKFTPIKAMAKYIDEIQDVLRLEGYPLFEKREDNQIRFDITAQNQQLEPSFDTITRWYITNVDKTAGFVLSNDFILFQTTDYKTHEPFFAALMLGLKTVLENAKPALITRIGIRYLDAVVPSEEESVEDYLAEGLHGISSNLRVVQSINESVFQTDVKPMVNDGILVAKVYKMNGTLAFPPDVVPYGVHMLPRFHQNTARWHGVIDTDHYVEGNLQPDGEKINQQLLSLHGVLKSAFESMVSTFAFEKWK